MSSAWYVFGYGSLIFAPELPSRVRAMYPATLRGYARSFNQRSRNRSYPVDLSYAALPPSGLPAEFFRSGRCISLALGTVQQPENQLKGMLLEYAAADRPEVQRLMDLREGYDEGRSAPLNGYLRRRVTVRRDDTRRFVQATVYLSNPDPRQLYYVAPTVTIAQRAQILINATPVDPGFDRAEHPAPGLYYLEGVRSDLRRAEIIDPHLERIASAVQDCSGPWNDWVHPALSPTTSY